MKKSLFIVAALVFAAPLVHAQNEDCIINLQPVLYRQAIFSEYTTGGVCSGSVPTANAFCSGSASYGLWGGCEQVHIPIYCQVNQPTNPGCVPQARQGLAQWLYFDECLTSFAPEDQWLFCDPPGGWPA